MDFRAFELQEDLNDADQFGRAVLKPSRHFSRLLNTLSISDRKRLLAEAYGRFKQLESGRITVAQFVSFALFGRTRRLDHAWVGVARQSRIEDLDEGQRQLVRETVQGQNTIVLSNLLHAAVGGTTLQTDQDFLTIFSNALGETATEKLAAAITSAVAESRAECQRFNEQAKNLIADGRLLPDQLYDRRADLRAKNMSVDTLRRTHKRFSRSYPLVLSTQRRFAQPEYLEEKFKLDVPTNLLVPHKCEILIAKSMQQAVEAAAKDRSAVMNMSPRRFEEFIAHILRELGFEVQLTQATRDGGADIICVSNIHGISCRTAIEVKRYSDTRPIDVSLVRSFVGANQQFRANRLLYITTSRYTTPAANFARDYAAHLLTLRQYDQIREWCQSVSSQA